MTREEVALLADTEGLKGELNAIISLVEELPERYRERAFELFVKDLLAKRREAAKSPQLEPETPGKKGGEGLAPFPARVRAFMHRHGIAEEQLRKLVLIEGREVHFIREPADTRVATGQIQWALLLGLKSALLDGEFLVDPEDVRSICIAKGLYDRANFAANFKRNKENFQQAPEPQGEPVRLSPKGESELGELIKKLVE